MQHIYVFIPSCISHLSLILKRPSNGLLVWKPGRWHFPVADANELKECLMRNDNQVTHIF